MRGHFRKRTYIDKKTGKRRKTSTWSVWYEVPHGLGERRKQKMKSGFRTRKEADAWLTQKAEELRQGVAPIDDRRTVQQYLEQWLESIVDTVSPSALHAYKNHVEKHIVPALGTVRLIEVQPQHIERAKAFWASSTPKRRKLAEGKLSTRTVHHIFSTLRVSLNRAKRQRLIALNPCELVDPPRVERKEMRALDGRGGAALVKALEASDLGAAIVTSLGTGLRRGELLALRWGDINLEEQRITVRRAIERVDRQTRFKDPKTSRSRRTISLPRFVADRLRRHHTEQGQRMMADGLGRPTPETLVFERDGQPWVPNTFGTVFMRALRDAGLPHLRLHETVSSALGHSTISTTADIYAHVTDSLMRDAADRIDRAVSSALGEAAKAS
jgi:integrase